MAERTRLARLPIISNRFPESWPGSSRPSTFCLLRCCKKGVDARDKRGHDGGEMTRSHRNALGLDDPLGGTADHRSAPVRECEILGRPHLDEARGRALELAGLVAFGSLVKGGRLRRSGSKKLHAGIVKRVDQCNETLGFI